MFILAGNQVWQGCCLHQCTIKCDIDVYYQGSWLEKNSHTSSLHPSGDDMWVESSYNSAILPGKFRLQPEQAYYWSCTEFPAAIFGLGNWESLGWVQQTICTNQSGSWDNWINLSVIRLLHTVELLCLSYRSFPRQVAHNSSAYVRFPNPRAQGCELQWKLQ